MPTRTPPETLVDATGRVHRGRFSASVPRINGRDHDYRTPMGRPAPARQRRFHYKQFQYFGLVSDELLLGCALADTAWLGVAFFYWFEPATGELHEYSWRSPLARQPRLSESPVEGVSRFRQKNVNIEMGYERSGETLTKSLTVDLPELQLQARMDEPSDHEPMALCTRTGVNGWTYTNKVAGLPVEGRLTHKGTSRDLAELDAGGHHDFSAGYMRRRTFWNWACLSGRTDGHWLGLNVSCGVNETSFTENCFWRDNELIKVDLVDFDYDGDDLMCPWRIRSGDGRVDLMFEPLNRHREKLNILLFASNFHQIFGRFTGVLRDARGHETRVDGLHGFVEEQYAQW